MIVSAVVDPSAVESDQFALPGYADQVYMFLSDIRENGLLIVDADGKLTAALDHALSRVPIQFRQKPSILLEEILKRGKRRVIASTLSSRGSDGAQGLLRLACRIQEHCGTDAIIVSNQSLKRLEDQGSAHASTLPLSRYIGSNLEATRRKFLDLKPADQLSESEWVDAIARAIRFSKWLRFYDKQIGKGNYTGRFRDGIEFILQLWRKHGYFAAGSDALEIKIITCTAEAIEPDDSDCEKREKIQRNSWAHANIMRELITPLKRTFGLWDIQLLMKEDPEDIFHARHLEAQSVIVMFERGFDLFKPGHVLKRNFLKISNGSYEHLRECRSLQMACLQQSHP